MGEDPPAARPAGEALPAVTVGGWSYRQDMSTGTAALTEREQQILDFEKTTWRYLGSKEDEIRRRFGLNATRYFQVLNALIDRPEALAYAPSTVRRLQRLRSTRAARRGR